MEYRMHRGFTLIETFVAMSILLIAIVGPLTIASRGIASAGFAKQQLIATYLAQEAVEYIRNVRDSNRFVSGSEWDEGFTECVEAACTIDIPLEDVSLCSSGVCPVIKHNSETGHYGYTSGTDWEDTVYRRTVLITPLSTSPSPLNSDEYEILVTVTWTGGLVPSKTITVREHIFDYDL